MKKLAAALALVAEGSWVAVVVALIQAASQEPIVLGPAALAGFAAAGMLVARAGAPRAGDRWPALAVALTRSASRGEGQRMNERLQAQLLPRVRVRATDVAIHSVYFPGEAGMLIGGAIALAVPAATIVGEYIKLAVLLIFVFAAALGLWLVFRILWRSFREERALNEHNPWKS